MNNMLRIIAYYPGDEGIRLIVGILSDRGVPQSYGLMLFPYAVIARPLSNQQIAAAIKKYDYIPLSPYQDIDHKNILSMVKALEEDFQTLSGS